MPSALSFFGIDDRWHPNEGRRHGFWARHEDDMEKLVCDVRKAIRSTLKTARTDFVENHEAAVEIVAVYQWLKRQFLKRGIRL